MLLERDVIAAYEQLLKRPPENFALIKDQISQHENLNSLISAIFASGEFQERHPEIDPAQMRFLVENTTHYQPLYGLSVLTNPEYSRICFDRAWLIERSFGKKILKQLKFLDIGCNVGYFSMFLAAREAQVHGIDMGEREIQLAQTLAKFHGLSCQFTQSAFNEHALERIFPLKYDAVLLLSVLHHIIAVEGLDYAVSLLQRLLDRTITLFFEVGSNKEVHAEPWKDQAVSDTNEVLGRLTGCKIEHLGTTSAMSGGSSRELYRVDRDLTKISFSGTIDQGDFKTIFSANDTALMHRFYQSGNYFAKFYKLQDTRRDEHLALLNEVNAYNVLRGSGLAPNLIDWRLEKGIGALILEHTEGKTLSTVVHMKEKPENYSKKRTFARIVEFLRHLRKAGLYWNDLRSHNIVIQEDGEVKFIDFEMCGTVEMEDSLNMLRLLLLELEDGMPIYAVAFESVGQTRRMVPPKITPGLLCEELQPYAKILQASVTLDDFLERMEGEAA